MIELFKHFALTCKGLQLPINEWVHTHTHIHAHARTHTHIHTHTHTRTHTIVLLVTLMPLSVLRPGTVCFEERIEACCVALRNELCHLNNAKRQYIQDLVHCAVNNLAADIRYQFLDAHGPKRREVTPTQPLFKRWVLVGQLVGVREFVHLIVM